MIADKDTNIVFLAKKLKEEQPDVFYRLTTLLDKLSIDWDLLKYTKAYWARDYMPIQVNDNEFLIYRYLPKYLTKDKEYKNTITNPRRTLRELEIECKETDVVLDGGNITLCGDYIVMTNKIFAENDCKENDFYLLEKIQKVFDCEIIIIPWHCDNRDDENADVYGHSDGLIRWCYGKKVLISNHREAEPEEAEEIKRRLEERGFEVTEMLFNVPNPEPDWNWAYINYLQVGNKIIIPSFGIDDDKQALNYVKEANPDCEISMFRMRDIAAGGGALHCITWNIKR